MPFYGELVEPSLGPLDPPEMIRSLQGNENFMRCHYFFETESQPTELFRFLESRYPVREQDGFLFFDLRES